MEEITLEQDGPFCTIRISGVLDRRLSTLMREEMAHRAQDGQTAAMIIDLSDVSQIDSMGIGMLVSAFRSCQARNMEFALVGVRENAGEILRITGLDAILPIHASCEEARDAFLSRHPNGPEYPSPPL